MIRINGVWQISGQSGTEEFTGTSSVALLPANTRKIVDYENQYFFGQISNLSNVDVRLSLKTLGLGSNIHSHDLRAKESINIKCLPIQELGIIINGSVLVHGMGVIVEIDNSEDLARLISGGIGLFEELHDYRHYTFPLTDHTDIAAAQTTTLITPTTGKSIRVYKITVAVAAANNVTLRFTNAAAGSADIIGTLIFASSGVFVYDFGDRGWENPNGEDGLLQAITSTAGDTDIDVIYEEVELQ